MEDNTDHYLLITSLLIAMFGCCLEIKAWIVMIFLSGRTRSNCLFLSEVPLLSH